MTVLQSFLVFQDPDAFEKYCLLAVFFSSKLSYFSFKSVSHHWFLFSQWVTGQYIELKAPLLLFFFLLEEMGFHDANSYCLCNLILKAQNERQVKGLKLFPKIKKKGEEKKKRK